MKHVNYKKKIKKNLEISSNRINKKRKNDDFSLSSQPTKKCKIDHDENMSDYIKKRRDILIYT